MAGRAVRRGPGCAADFYEESRALAPYVMEGFQARDPLIFDEWHLAAGGCLAAARAVSRVEG
jgi:hypothetical protein